MGITEKELFAIAAVLPYSDGIKAVALAAQRALLREIDVLAELVDCEDVWQNIRAKLGVKPL